MRTTRPQMFMQIAQVVAMRSTCMRLNVGAVLVQNRSIVSIGYNGAPAGALHCQGNSCPGKSTVCTETIHAERNAIDHLPPLDYQQDGRLDLYVTDSPCLDCFNLIWSGGRGIVKRIFFGTPYRINDHLLNSGEYMSIYRVLPAGYTIDWKTKDLVDVET